MNDSNVHLVLTGAIMARNKGLSKDHVILRAIESADSREICLSMVSLIMLAYDNPGKSADELIQQIDDAVSQCADI